MVFIIKAAWQNSQSREVPPLKGKRAHQKKGRVEKKKPPRLGLAVLISAIIVAVVILGYALFAPVQPSLLGPGASAPDFELPVVNAQGISTASVRLSSLKGKVVFVEFMVSWCKACQEMAPVLDSLRYDYEPEGVVFISVAGTQQGATAETTAEFIRTYGTDWTYVLDSDNSIFTKYAVDSTPTFFVIGQDGKIVSRLAGIVPTASFVSALDLAVSGG
jgi:thiol-disulfide isomerase/thioredoxin